MGRRSEFQQDRRLAAGERLIHRQMIKSLLQKYQGKMIFIHLDQYTNPEAYRAYHVPGDPWTYDIDGRGVIRFQQAGAMLYGELENAIQSAL
ncbi:MAG: hypothetical protein ACLPTF_13615 [Steroidobacteraceae bacterium]